MAADGKTGGLRAARLRINSVSSTIRPTSAFSIFAHASSPLPFLPPTHGVSDALRVAPSSRTSSRKKDNFATVVVDCTSGNLNPHLSSQTDVPFPLSRNLVVISDGKKSSRDDNYWRDGKEKGKSRGWREERRERGRGKNDRRRACKGEREGSGKGTRSKMLRWSATERSAKASFPVHFLTTITFM